MKKDTQIDDTTQYGRSITIRQDNSYDNDSIKMNKSTTMPYPPPYYHIVGGGHPYPTHQYHHPYYNMSHMPSNPIYPQPATTANNNATANNNQTATLQYNNATTSKQQQEEKEASSSSMHHMSQYHLPPPMHHTYPYPYMPHNVQQSSAQYQRLPPMQHQYVNSNVSDDQMAAFPIKHDGRKRKSILQPPLLLPPKQYRHHHLTSAASDGDISDTMVPNAKKYRNGNYSRQVITTDDTHHTISQVAPPPPVTTWPQINNASTNVIVLPALKRYTRKKKYCIQEGCKLKQKKGEYCFKHSMAIIHDGSVPEYLIPPTPTANTETPQEVPPTHKAVVHSVDAISAVLSIAAVTQQIQVQPTRTQRDNHLSTVNTDLCNMPKLLRHQSRSSVNRVKDILADHLQDHDVATVSASTAAVTQKPQIQPTHTQKDTHPSAVSVAKTPRVQVQPTPICMQKDNLSTVNDLCNMPKLLRHESRSSVNRVKEVLADHLQEGLVTTSAAVVKEKQPQVQLTHPSAISVAKTPRVLIQSTPVRIQRDNRLSAVKDMYEMPELLRHQSTSSVSSKLMAREILGIDTSERSARSTTPKNVQHVEIANISQIESLDSQDDQLVAFMNEFRDDLESQRGDDNDHILS